MSIIGGVVADDHSSRESIHQVGKSLAVVVGGGGVVVTPTVSASDQTVLDFVAAVSFVGIRAVAGATDAAEADDTLADGFPGMNTVSTGKTTTILMDTKVSNIFVIGIAEGAVGGKCMNTTDTSTNAAAQMTQFDFSPSVNKITITCTDTWNSGTEAQAIINGYVI